MRLSTLAPLLAGALAAATLAPPAAEAGDRRLAAVWVNMTPDAASSAASKACVGDLAATLAAGYTEITKLGETALRKKVGKTAGEPFLAWPAEVFESVQRSGNDTFDTVILVDCRPETQQLDILIVPRPGTATIQLRHTAIDRKVTDWVGVAMMRRAWAQFSP